MKNPSLEEIASAELIARSGDTTALRATLAALTPTTRVSDGDFDGTMLELAATHSESDPNMTQEQAWGWACADLVFGGFDVVDPP